jgi:hypothetical protein
VRFNKEETAFVQHILGNRQQYGSMEQIMEVTEYARKGNTMNVKKNYCIYQFEQRNELIEEQNSIKENDNQNSMFDILIRHEYTPPRTSQEHGYKCATQHTTNSASEHSKKEQRCR